MADSADSTGTRLARAAIALTGAAIAAVAGWALFVWYPQGNLATLLGVLLFVGLAGVGLRVASGIASSLFTPYNVAEVSVDGPITRDGSGGPLPTSVRSTPADDIVDQLERAERDEAVDGLIVHLNTPGGEVVPSDDIRRAAQEFDGPTVAYATDTCASGGYWIASGCDRIVAREGSLVGSIGVLGSRPNFKGLADRLGVEYEQLTAGEYKDAGQPLKEFTDADREYLQGLIDGYYETFVDRVTEGRDLSAEEVRDTEARVYLGEEAQSVGLVDELGTREDVADFLEETLETPVTIEPFEPERGLTARVGIGARRVAYALGAGVASVLGAEDGVAALQFR
ncbi:MAG: signal peptide peptidase SppA [Halobacteriaceae archaeon]